MPCKKGIVMMSYRVAKRRKGNLVCLELTWFCTISIPPRCTDAITAEDVPSKSVFYHVTIGSYQSQYLRLTFRFRKNEHLFAHFAWSQGLSSNRDWWSQKEFVYCSLQEISNDGRDEISPKIGWFWFRGHPPTPHSFRQLGYCTELRKCFELLAFATK